MLSGEEKKDRGKKIVAKKINGDRREGELGTGREKK